jgi:hypothetical protein
MEERIEIGCSRGNRLAWRVLELPRAWRDRISSVFDTAYELVGQCDFGGDIPEYDIVLRPSDTGDIGEDFLRTAHGSGARKDL